jgi:UDP-3-O-[3-hydroxymyristoyl] N-acetylglucosamine deacetylase
MKTSYFQKTVARPASCKGVGIHSGREVNLSIYPAPANHGIKFMRKDLPNSPDIRAHFNKVVDTSLATVIGYEGFIISTIEHLMASFAGLAIDNARVEIDAYEMPIMDGSAEPFTALIKSAGFEIQEAPRCFFIVKKPIVLQENGKSVGIYPDDKYQITCSIAYDHPLINEQTLSIEINEHSFVNEISKARTFGFLQEYEQLKRFGLARGGSLDNVVVIDQHDVLNESGLRYQDEFVRHKVLDCMGDFSLLGMPVIGHIKANKSGHAFHYAFLKKFFESKGSWVTGTFEGADRPDAA